MIERENATRTPKNHRVETPETRRLLDYQIGDYVQIVGKGDLAGKMGVIIGIRAITYRKTGEDDLAYRIKLTDTKSVELSALRLRFLRHSDGKI